MRAPLRVLFVNPGRAMGGAEQSLSLLLQGLRSRGVESLVALFDDGPFHQHLTEQVFRTLCLKPLRGLRGATRYRDTSGLVRSLPMIAAGFPTLLRLVSLVRHHRVDIIHTNGLKAHMLAGCAGRLAGIPVVWHLRDFPPAAAAGRILRTSSRYLPALVLTNSDAVAQAVQTERDAIPRVTRLYNPVDLERFRPGLAKTGLRRELGIGARVPLVGCVAHLTPWKGHEQFLAIARDVQAVCPETHFVVAGGAIYETDGHHGYAAQLRQRAQAMGIADRVTFLGARDDVPEILSALNVLVHCPVAPEPFGRVLAEAMAVGCPVVASRCGGIPEVVEDGVTGNLVSPGDLKGFVTSVAAYLNSPSYREIVGKAGRRRAEALFGVEAHTAAVLRAYQSLIHRGAAFTCT